MTSSTLITDYLGQGLAASRPATLTLPAGCVGFYLATDTGVLSGWNGSAWVTVSPSALSALPDVSVTEGAGIDGYALTWNNAAAKWEAVKASGGGGSIEAPFTAPVLANFTAQNFGTNTLSASFTGAGTGIRLSDPGTPGSNVDAHRQLLVPVPSATAWTAIGRFRRNAAANNYVIGGMSIRDSVSGRSYCIGFAHYTGGLDIRVFSNDNALYDEVAIQPSDSEAQFWIKAVWASNVLNIYMSTSGDFWYRVFSVPLATIFEESANTNPPTHVGIGIDPNLAWSVNAGPAAIDCLSWALTTP